MSRRAFLSLVATVACALGAGGCGTKNSSIPAGGPGANSTPATPPTTPAATAPAGPKPKIAKPSGPPPKTLVVKDLRPGRGPGAKAGDQLGVQYVGVVYKTGKEFDSSYGRGQPLDLQLGGGQVIPGWDKGLVGMKLGGRRELIIPPALAYGKQGRPPTIPPNSTLIFDIDLVKIG
jgi:peptidylprolyl isomerase